MLAAPGMQEKDGLWELSEDLSASPIYNHDLAPTTADRRTWGVWAMASLWIGMSVCIPTYMLAAGLIGGSGMTWWQAVGTILLGNLIVLVPMILNGHAGTKFGIPFPVLLRAAFGTRGSNIPALLRAFVACGWFGIQTWIGGHALYQLLLVFFPAWKDAQEMAFLGLNIHQLQCFLAFWALNIGIILVGVKTIKWVEELSAPFLLAIGLALLGWGFWAAGGPGPALGQSSQFRGPTLAAIALPDGLVQVSVAPVVDPAGNVRARTVRAAVVGANLPEADRRARLDEASPVAIVGPTTLLTLADPGGDRVAVARLDDAAGHTSPVLQAPVAAQGAAGGGIGLLGFLVALTGMVGFWATLALNIPDFTRFARNQRSQALGQALGLPTTMALFSFIGVAVTCSAVVAFPDILVKESAPWDPVDLLGRFHHPVVVVVSMVGLAVATLTTNIAANVVSPANDISNIAPSRISFRMGGLITGLVGILMMPWKLLATFEGYLFTWLVGYSALLGPIAGILIADYFIVQRRMLHLKDLYTLDGVYGRIRWRTVIVLVLAILPNLPGFLLQFQATAPLVPSAIQEHCRTIYHFAWFLGFAIAFVLHTIVAKRVPRVEFIPQVREE